MLAIINAIRITVTSHHTITPPEPSDLKNKISFRYNNMAPSPRGTKRARLTMSPEPEADASLAALVPADTPVPAPNALVHINKSEDNKWGYNPHQSSRRACVQECCSEITSCWDSSDLTKRPLPPRVMSMMKTIRHVLESIWLEKAFNEPSMSTKPYMMLHVPPIILAMSLDWDLSCAYPFLKRLCHELENGVACGKGSGKKDDVDMVLSLTSSIWTKGNVIEPVPICPVVVHNRTHKDTTSRLKKWLVSHFDCLGQNKFACEDYEWPVPYFVLEGPIWTVGIAIKGESDIELHEESAQSLKWNEGARTVMLVLAHIIGLTADRYREWHLEKGANQQPLEEG